MNTHNKPAERPAPDDAEKIVNFLGIKQSWWQTTSIIHAVLMFLYGAWYLSFELSYEGRVSDIVYRFALHMIAVSGLTMFAMLTGIQLGVLMMMLHEWYREKLSRRRRALEESVRVAEETARVAEEARRVAEETARTTAETIAQIAAWNERRVAAAENGEHFDEPMPNGQPLNVAEALRQEQAAAHAWYERRIAAAEKGEPFDEPPPNGSGAAVS